MGSLIARAYTKQYDSGLDMLILSGSPSENPMLGLGKCVAHLEKFIFGDRHKKPSDRISFLRGDLPDGLPGKRTGMPGSVLTGMFIWNMNVHRNVDLYLRMTRTLRCLN